MATTETVAVLGAGGTMGAPMARNLVRAGFTVRGWNRTRERAEPLADDGVVVVETPADATDGAGVIVTMLSDANAVLETMDGEHGVLHGILSENMVWLQTSTIGERGTGRCIELADGHGLAFVDAPVLGTKQPAEDGKLVVLASGAAALRPQVEPVFDAIGQRTMWVGEARAGTRLKLAINGWIVTVVEGVAETFALAEGLGLDPQLVLDALDGGALDLPYMRLKGRAIMAREFTPSFRLALAAKDAGLVTEAAEQRGLDLPMLRTIRERLAEGAQRYGDEDFSATYRLSAPAP
jgi:3-hydroxyisobutyrate dehydrogenase